MRVDELGEIVRQMGRHARIEHALVERLAGQPALGDEPCDQLVTHALLDCRERSSDEWRCAVLEERAKDDTCPAPPWCS